MANARRRIPSDVAPSSPSTAKTHRSPHPPSQDKSRPVQLLEPQKENCTRREEQCRAPPITPSSLGLFTNHAQAPWWSKSPRSSWPSAGSLHFLLFSPCLPPQTYQTNAMPEGSPACSWWLFAPLVHYTVTTLHPIIVRQLSTLLVQISRRIFLDFSWEHQIDRI